VNNGHGFKLKTMVFRFSNACAFGKINKEERYSRESRLSDIRYSAKGKKGNGDMQAAKRE